MADAALENAQACKLIKFIGRKTPMNFTWTKSANSHPISFHSIVLRQCLALFAVLAFTFSVLTLTSCRFFEILSEDGNKQSGGLFRISYRFEECYNYNDLPGEGIEFDASTQVARAFGIIAAILGGVALLIVFGMQCLMPPRRLWRFLAFCLLGAFFSQSLTFLIWKQIRDNQCSLQGQSCSMGVGTVWSITSTVLYLLMGTTVLVLLPPPTATAYNCPRLNNGLRRVIQWTGITRKKDAKKHLQSLSWMHYLVLLVSLVAFAFSLAVLFGCRFFQVNVQDRSLKSGLFGYLYPPTDSCRLYEYGTRTSFLTSTKAAQAFAVLAVFFGGILFILLWNMILLLDFPKLSYKMLWFCAFWGGLSQGLTFLFMKEVNDRICGIAGQTCDLSVDGILAAIATPLYLLMIPVVCRGSLVRRSEDDQEEGMKDVDDEEGLDEAPLDEEAVSSPQDSGKEA
jgi:hypothetical protein